MKLLDDKGDIADLVKYRLDVAKQDLADARLLFEHNSLLSANNRIYYAVFHAINAVHALDGNGYKRHKDVIAYFNNLSSLKKFIVEREIKADINVLNNINKIIELIDSLNK